MISQDIIANLVDNNDYKNWISDISKTYNDESNLQDSSNSGNPSAQLYSDAYMKLQQREPLTFSYFKKSSDTSPTELTMYINPNKLQFSNQKLIGKAITREGIFYNHIGPDNSTIQLSGTTGLSGMKGIKQLEEIYYASGTLLRYNNYLPIQVNSNVTDYQNINYSDPYTTTSNIITNNYDSELSNTLLNNVTKSVYNFNILNIAQQLININTNNNDIYNILYNNQDGINTIVNNSDSYSQCYQRLLSYFNTTLGSYNSTIINELSYEIAISKYTPYNTNNENTTLQNNIGQPLIENLSNFYSMRQTAISNQLAKLKNFQNRNDKINNLMYSAMSDLKVDMKDQWLPRRIIMYFENNAFYGFFNNFSYQRDAAQQNYITYNLQFVVERQYEFNDINNSSSVNLNNIISDTTYNSISTSSSSSSSNKNQYVVKSGDSLSTIAQKFYGDSSLWPEIYADNLNILNPDMSALHVGVTLTISTNVPNSKYFRWVVRPGDNLSTISQRFYGTQNKWKDIYNYNTNIIGTNYIIYPRTILYIPR